MLNRTINPNIRLVYSKRYISKPFTSPVNPVKLTDRVRVKPGGYILIGILLHWSI
ncbi:hypothetical protein Hanom_Chr07g00665431 [Helianthus anomalus]